MLSSGNADTDLSGTGRQMGLRVVSNRHWHRYCMVHKMGETNENFGWVHVFLEVAKTFMKKEKVVMGIFHEQQRKR